VRSIENAARGLLRFLFVAAALVPSGAWAQESPAPKRRWPTLSVDAQVGLGAPLGLAGVGLEVAGDWLVVGAGVGVGVSGPQMAATARCRLRLHAMINLTVGAGASAGPYEWVEPFIFDDPARKHWDIAVWVNGEIGLELGSPTGLRLRPFVGIGSILNRQAGACVGDTIAHCKGAHSGDGFNLPFVGVAVVYAVGSGE